MTLQLRFLKAGLSWSSSQQHPGGRFITFNKPKELQPATGHRPRTPCRTCKCSVRRALRPRAVRRASSYPPPSNSLPIFQISTLAPNRPPANLKHRPGARALPPSSSRALRSHPSFTPRQHTETRGGSSCSKSRFPR